MDTATLQSALVVAGFGPLAIDGDFGPRTARAVDAFLDKHSGQLRPTARRNTKTKFVAAEQLIYEAAGIEAGSIDGLLGPQTLEARVQWAALKVTGKPPAPWRDELMVPRVSDKAPSSAWPTQAGVSKFFGEVGKNQTMLELPYACRLDWDLKQTVRRTSCHEKVHDSMKRALGKALSAYGPQRLTSLGLDRFGGCLNVRKMRGGSSWSMHAWGIASDWWPSRNQLAWGRDRAVFAKPEYDEWWRIWESEGWVSLGRIRNFDWMHVQAARI